MASAVSRPVRSIARRTPDALVIRRAMIGAILLGMLAALPGAMLPIWSVHLALDTGSIGQVLLAFAMGSAAGIAAAGRRRTGEPGRKLLATVAGVLASSSLVALSGVYSPARLLLPILGMGLSLGILLGTESRSLFEAVVAAPASRTLAQVCFGAGATLACLLLWASLDVAALPSAILLLAAAPLLFSAYVWSSKADRAAAVTDTGEPIDWKSLATPMGILFGLSIVLHAAAHGSIAYWIAIYMTRRFGFSLGVGMIILTLYWLSLTAGSAVAARIPPLETRLRWLLGTVAACVISCAFLLETADVSGAVAGSVVFGAALGAIQTLAAGWISRRVEWRHPTLFRVLVAGYFIAAMAAASAMSELVSGFGVQALVWAALAATLTLFLLLAVSLVEARLTAGKPAAS